MKPIIFATLILIVLVIIGMLYLIDRDYYSKELNVAVIVGSAAVAVMAILSCT